MLTSGGDKEKLFLRSTISPKNELRTFNNSVQKRKSEGSWKQRSQIMKTSEMVKT